MSFCNTIKRYFQHYIVKYFLLFIWIITLTFIVCKLYGIYQNNEPEYYYLQNILGKGLCVARGTSQIIHILIVVIMLQVSKLFNNFLHYLLRKISIICCFTFYIEKLKIIHITFAIGLILVSFIHTGAHIMNAFNFIKYYDELYAEINWANGRHDSIFRLLFVTPTGFSGFSMLLLLLIIWAFSTHKIRERFFNSFFAAHHLFIVFLTLLYYHSLSKIIKYQYNLDEHEPGCTFNRTISLVKCSEPPKFSPLNNNHSWMWPTISLGIFFIDRTVRFLIRNTKQIQVIEALQYPSEAIFLRLKFKNNILDILPTQYILLQCQNLSVLEWHPFTVTECPSKDDPSFTLLIGARGDWTNDLYRYVSNLNRNIEMHQSSLLKKKLRNKPQTLIPLTFLIDGPFPSPLENLLKEKIVVCCAVDIGITPFIAIFNELLRGDYKKPTRIHLVWIIAKLDQILWFSKLFELILEKFWKENQPDRIELQFYITDNYSMTRASEMFKMEKFQWLKSRLHSGRPCWNTYFDYLGFLYKKSPVAIYGCGPRSFIQRIQSNCNDQNRNGFNYTFLYQKLGQDNDN